MSGMASPITDNSAVGKMNCYANNKETSAPNPHYLFWGEKSIGKCLNP